MSSFRILALHISKDCREDLLKILQLDSTYYFLSGYRYNSNLRWLEVDETCTQLASDFFSVTEHPRTFLNFSAIVGKNGDGKSTLIDMILRILNNFSYYAGYRNHHKTLTAIEGLYSTLYFEADKKIYAIESAGNKVVLHNQRDKVELDNPAISRFIYKDREYANFDFPLFNSIIYNFSQYAFHSYEYDGESCEDDKNWLRSMLDKNDKYQVPVNIVPYRLEGNIDMKTEASLNHQRMLDFFTNVWCGLIPDSNFMPYGVAYKLANDEKLVKKVLTITNEQKTKVPEYPKNLFGFWEEEFYPLYTKYTYFYDVCYKVSNKYVEKNSVFFNKTVAYLREANYPSGPKSVFFKKFSCLPLVLHKRISLIIAVYEFWKDSGLIKNFNGLELRDVLFKDSDSEKYQCLLYILYKTINLLDNFPDRFFDCANSWLYDNRRVLVRALRLIKEDVTSQDGTLLTLKIRQSLNFINYCDFMGYSSRSSIMIDGYTHFINFQDLRQVTSDCSKQFDIVKNARNNPPRRITQKQISFLLPPIYTTEIVISSGNDYFTISKMSSGQRQLLNLVSTLSYHLNNIDEIPVLAGWVNYSNVNIILDEIDLYFHPEYQRKIVKFLIEIFSGISYEKINSINFIVSTHSPFVLSDIPRQNVLFLKDGKQDYSMQENTFGANIHTLLKNGFFLEGMPIGDFAKEKINNLFGRLNGIDKISSADLDQIESLALLVSEPLLRKQLLSLIASRRPLCLNDEIEQLKRRIADLEGRGNA